MNDMDSSDSFEFALVTLNFNVFKMFEIWVFQSS